jgi:hypothetical protein
MVNGRFYSFNFALTLFIFGRKAITYHLLRIWETTHAHICLLMQRSRSNFLRRHQRGGTMKKHRTAVLAGCLALSVFMTTGLCFSETITFDEVDDIPKQCGMNSYYNGYFPAWKILGHFYRGFWLYDRVNNNQLCYTAPNYGATFGGGTVSFGSKFLPKSPYRFISRTIRWCSSSPPPPYSHLTSYPMFRVNGGFNNLSFRYRITQGTGTGDVVGKVVMETPLNVYSEEQHEEHDLYETGLLQWQTVNMGAGRQIKFELPSPAGCIEIDDIAFNRAFQTIPPPPVKDTIPPVIEITGESLMEWPLGSTPFEDPGATAKDNKDGTVAVDVVFNNVVADAVGDYTIKYEAKDAAGNTATAKRIVLVRPVGYQELDVLLLDKRFIDNLDPVRHISDDATSTTFRISFMLIPHSSRITSDWMEGWTPCESMEMRISDLAGGRAKQIGCYFGPICPEGGECRGEEEPVEESGSQAPGLGARLDVDFKIQPNGDGYYFENGQVEMCDKLNPSTCRVLDCLHNFTVYGTSFDIGWDGFAFKNGAWGEGAWVIDSGTSKIYNNDLAIAGHVVANYLNSSDKQRLWHNIGYFFNNLQTEEIVQFKKTGLCFGMAATALANFNYGSEDTAWGVGNFSEVKWDFQIKAHWDNTTHEAIRPYKPLAKRTHLYGADDIEAMKKIIYHHVLQSSYENDENAGYWNGEYVFNLGLEDKVYRNIVFDKMKKNNPFIFAFYRNYLTKDLVLKSGGHAVLGTQFISYNNIDKWYLYDNNLPGKYLYYRIADNRNYTVQQYLLNDEIFLDSKAIYSSLKYARPSFELDTSHIYKRLLPVGKSNTSTKTIDYDTPEHIEIDLVGGNYETIVIDGEGLEIVPLPCVGKLDPIESCQRNTNIFNNYLYLPVDKTYKVSVRKESGFPYLEIFVKIPREDGTIELINYEDVQTDAEQDTRAIFHVGRENTDKTLVRMPGSPMPPAYDTLFKRAISPVSHPVFVRLQGGVRFFWENPDHPDFAEVIVVRSEKGWPESVTEGTEVYRGSAEQFVDTGLTDDREYFYGFFVKTEDGKVHTPVMQLVAEGTRGVYGKVVDGAGSSIADTDIVLTDEAGSVVATRTNRNGFFALNGLTPGAYRIHFQHHLFAFTGQDRMISIEDSGDPILEVNASGSARSLLETSVRSTVHTGMGIPLRWNGLHVDGQATVRIRMLSAGQWHTIASGVPFAQHQWQWQVGEPENTQVTLRVELTGTPDIFSEKSVAVLGKEKPKSTLLMMLPAVIAGSRHVTGTPKVAPLHIHTGRVMSPKGE